jgi:transposase
MGKLQYFDLQNQALDLYRQGMILADIAKVLNVSANTVTTWKSRFKWDELCPDRVEDKEKSKELQSTTRDKAAELLEKVHIKLLEALNDKEIVPKKWRDIIDTLEFLTRDLSPVKKKEQEITVNDLDDKDLDMEIAQLQKLASRPIDEAIVLDKDDVIELERSD